jgi:quercetin dioxygenase-like cupin family protein
MPLVERTSAQQPPPPPPISVEVLTPRASFTDNIDLEIKVRQHRHLEVINLEDPSRTVVARITVQPHAQFPWHTHPGGRSSST